MKNQELQVKFQAEAGDKTIEGVIKCPDDDGTTTLPMVLLTLVKQLSAELPFLHTVGRIKLEVEVVR